MFLSFFKIGAFTFGGGYAMIPIIEKEFVENKNWISKEEFMDSLVIAQSIPGPMAVNCSVFVGYKVGKIKGALAAVLGTVLPSVLIILLVASVLTGIRDNKFVDLGFKGISAAVPVLVLVAITSLSKSVKKNSRNIIICIVMSILLIFFNLSPAIAIVVGLVYGALFCREEVKK
ncbi:MAG: chromate transporter [Sarcina sp.]